jgi:hypothetical protein
MRTTCRTNDCRAIPKDFCRAFPWKRRFDLGWRLTQTLTIYEARTAFFFPIVERLAVDLVNGSFADSHAARLSSHEEINVINCAAGSFHVDTREIFPAANTRELIVMDLDQIKREIFATILDVKFSVVRFFGVVGDVSLNSGRDISIAHLSCLHAVLLGS